MASMDVSVIIVNYKTPELTLACIDSLKMRTGGSIEYEIIVVDNGSHDGVKHLLCEKHPGVKVIESAVNLGFGKANNKRIITNDHPIFFIRAFK